MKWKPWRWHFTDQLIFEFVVICGGMMLGFTFAHIDAPSPVIVHVMTRATIVLCRISWPA